jgi:cysteine desulfuration protein SufE
MSTRFEQIAADFEFLDDWEDRYRYIIELGRELGGLTEAEKTAQTKVDGCASQVWLVSAHSSDTPPVFTFRGDSDAHIVRGLVAIITAAFSGRTADAIGALDADQLLAGLGLDSHLSQQRSNGLRAMVRRIKSETAAA